MNHYLSIIAGDYDNFKNESYKNGLKPNYESKQQNLKTFFCDVLGFKHIRYTDTFEINENPNDNFFYFVNDIIDFDVEDNMHDWNNAILKKDCMDKIINNENCFLVFIHENDTSKNQLAGKIDNLAKVHRIHRHKIMSFTYGELTHDLVNNLISNVKLDTFNIVYENWSEDGNSYFANLNDNPYGYRYRIQVGLFRFYNLFNKIRAVNLDEVQSYPDLNFYYFINGDQIDQHFKKNNTIPLSDKFRTIFNENKNVNIIILNEHEYENEEFVVFVDSLVRKDNLDPKRVYLMTNNSKLNYYKEKHGLEIDLYSLDFLVMFIATHMVENGKPNFIEDKTGKFFMCHNRGPKPHRYGLLCMLKKNNLLDYVDWSLILGWYRKNERTHNIDRIFYDPVFNSTDFEYYQNEVNYFGEIDIKKSDYEEEKTWFDDRNNAHIEWKNVYEYQTYENSYVNIVTESCYENPEIHITEKSMKPFYFYQFPLFLGSYNHVKYLKDRFGFDMFDDIIDHSYDDEKDNRLRIIKFFNEVKRLYDNQHILKEFYKNNKERFIYNNEVVVEIKNSKRDYNFFESLISKKNI